jgi:RNA polymerase subunit RPABC4/transcription elongation factor Spt4
MGIFLSRRCYRCKSVVGWDAKLCGYCQFRSGNEDSRGPAISEIEPEPVYNFDPTEDVPRNR